MIFFGPNIPGAVRILKVNPTAPKQGLNSNKKQRSFRVPGENVVGNLKLGLLGSLGLKGL